MPALIPFAVGFVIGVCASPSLRRHPQLAPVFETADAVLVLGQDVC